MKQSQAEILQEVLAEVLRSFVYIFPDAAGKDDLALSEEAYACATMRLKGRFGCVLHLMAPASVCLQITANILGYDESDPFVTSNPDDGIKELLNIICGHVATRLLGADEVFSFSIPESIRFHEPSYWDRAVNSDDSVGILADGKPILLQMRLE